jgi:hypothetical protein
VDVSGNIVTTKDQTFTTKAGNATLSVKVIDQNSHPVKGAKVTIGQDTGTTDKNGHVVLDGLAAGSVSVTVDYKGQKTTKSIQVEPPTETVQGATIKIEVSKNYLPIILLPTIGLIALAAGAFFLNGGGPKLSFLGSGISDAPVVGGNAGATTLPGGAVVPPVSSTPTAAPATASTSSTSTTKGAEPFDPSKEPPPPTIVRPTIPPRG